MINSALVAEGGGQKGIFTAGVLDAFLEQKFTPFDLKVGVSAGAQNLAAYCARAHQYAHTAISQLTTEQNFFRPARFFTGGNVIDLDWYFHQIQQEGKVRFPTTPTNLTPQSNFYAVASHFDSFAPHYLHTWHDNIFDHLKASSAIPFLYRPGVEVKGHGLMDGGVADPIPVRWAHEQGAKTIWVIRTVEAHDDGKMPILERLKPIMSRINQSPRMFAMYHHYQHRYADAVDFMKAPPEGVNIVQIAPTRPLHSMTLGSDAKNLQDDYRLGFELGMQAVKKWSVAPADAG
ncbi:patatin-like phospholipase family protein [Pseudoalteromonas sp. T1lg75]|uniref:patatin-like phospholipase family protein n=1 Tax=Pseudoalteromonas sp. T1lg75 TaxID=2077102 RepID=UPI001F2536F7|nr:patatin family protein [Pseudoalteromonas sp. T1lg75]